jgi:hypothetical protein
METKTTTAQARRLAAAEDRARTHALKLLIAWQKTQDAHETAKHIAIKGLPTYAPMKQAAAAYKTADLELQAARRAAKRARQQVTT